MQPTQSNMLLRTASGTLAAHHHIGDREPAARLQHAKGFAQHAILVGGEIDHAVRDDHIDRVVGQGNVLDFALQKLDILHARLPLVFARQRQHLVGHVQPIGFARGTDALGGEQHVDAASGAQIEHHLAGLEVRSARSDCRIPAKPAPPSPGISPFSSAL